MSEKRVGEMHTVAGRLKSLRPLTLPSACWMEVGERNPGTATVCDTVTHWTEDVAADAKSELVSLPPSCKFASRVDESTDGTRLAALFVFVCYQPQLNY